MAKHISPLRDLARVVNVAAREHKAYSQVVTLFQHIDEYLSMRAYIEEQTQNYHTLEERLYALELMHTEDK